MLGSSGRNISGLLGNADGISTNDFRLRDGTDLGDTISSATLYSTFADSWRITDATSLFTYGAGESTASFTDRSFPHAIVTLADLDPTVRAAAEQTASNAGLTRGTLAFDNAVLDVALTGNAEFATLAAALSRAEARCAARGAGRRHGHVERGWHHERRQAHDHAQRLRRPPVCDRRWSRRHDIRSFRPLAGNAHRQRH